MRDGFVKVASASPVIKVADPDYNSDIIIDCINKADSLGVKVLVFPELCLTGCTCGDILNHRVMLDAAKNALIKIVEASFSSDMLVFIGVPVEFGSRVLSCAAAICNGELLGVVPKDEFAPATELNIGFTHSCILSRDMLFEHSLIPSLKVSVEIGSDITAIDPPSVRHAKEGATLIARMASFPETISSTYETEKCICADTKRLSCAMLLAAPGRGESTTDRSWSGLCIAAESGEILSKDEGADSFVCSEIDIQYLMNLRRSRCGFDSDEPKCFRKLWGKFFQQTELTRSYSKHPHLPNDSSALDEYCERIIDIQVSGLVKRLESTGIDHCVVGISGGVDSTLAVMISSMAIRRLCLPPSNVIACTLPCFGTSSRTKNNAVVVAEQWGCDVRVINISESVNAHFDAIGHARDDYSIAFENAQARERTMVLMDIANKTNGIDVGTEDLSEYIDGWCTYNGDHTSMYDVNLGLTKTQVRAVVSHIASTTEDTILKAALYDVLDCPVTPELLPIHDDLIEQKSEDAVGSYSLQDFFTHKILICGFTPSKTRRLAKIAYGDEFSDEELNKWLSSWCKRLFSQQFKRSCLMDGPSIEAFSVSPRIGLSLPSDADATALLAELEKSFDDPDSFGDYREY